MAPVNPRIISSVLIVLFLLLTIGMVYSLSVETHMALKGAVQDKLISVASVTASQIDGDAFSQIGPGDENTSEFTRVRDQLRSIKEATTGIRYIYTMRKNGDVIAFVVDADFGSDPNAPHIDDPYPEAEPEMYAGFIAPTADKEFTTDEWGTVLSGFSPIYDRAGNVVGIVGVDMDSSVVSSQLDYLNLFFYGIGIISLIAVVSAIIVIEHRRVIDARRVEESERKYRLLFERAADAIFLIEAEGQGQGAILSANQAATRMHGYSEEELLQMNLHDIETSQTKKQIVDRFTKILKGTWIQGEVTHQKRDGTIFPVEFSAGVLDLGQKKVIIAIFRDITDRKKSDDALRLVTEKLNLLNAVTFNDIQNALFTLNGYLSLSKSLAKDEKLTRTLDRAEESLKKVSRSLNFAKSYQDLGAKPPRWQDVNQVFIVGISHLDFSKLERCVRLDNLEIFADSLLERVFLSLADNVLRHAGTATSVTLDYRRSGENLILVFADNGQGIPYDRKEMIFERGSGSQKGLELFLIREILGITGITITETGEPGSGARFEMVIPKGGYRFLPAAS